MKRTLLFIACVLASLTIQAQEYYPEGTKWTEIRLDTLKYDHWYSKVGDEWVPNFETIEYYVKGEYTTTYGDKYICVYTNGPEWTDSLTLLIRETDNNVSVSVPIQYYDWNDNLTNGALWPGTAYQFDWSVGKGIYYEDISYSNTTGIPRYYCYYGIIDEIKEGDFGGVRPLKYVDLDGKAPECGKYDNPQKVDTQGGRIIQGIGITEWNDGECLFGPPNPYSASGGEYQSRHYRSMLVHFERNEEVLYDVWPNPTSQDDYIPFVELGKQWHVVSNASYPYSPSRYERYDMFAEVERDGKTYVHIGLIDDGVDTEEFKDAGLFREENRRVYKYDGKAGKDVLMYDFSLKEGDTFTYEFDYGQPVNCKVLKLGWLEDGPKIAMPSTTPADTLDIKYRRLRTWTIGREYGSGEYYEVVTWVEGVGTLTNMFDSYGLIGRMSCLAYIERKDAETDYHVNTYLPFSFYNMYGPTHGCNLPTGAENNEEDEWSQHHLTYELEEDRLHVYGDVFSQCGPNNYAYFIEKTTDDPMVRKIEFKIQEVTPVANCMALHATNFYVPGFDPNLNYIVVDNHGEEHPVINKTPQNEYRPFIEDGKVWTVYACSDANPDMEPWREYFYFAGDTIVGGQTCKQMKKIRNASEENWVNGVFTPANSPQEYVGAWYEQDKKVYFARAGKDHPELFYDFTLCSNDTIYPFGDPLVPLVVNKISGGLPGFKGTYYEFRYDGQIVDRWLEGVGNIYHPAYNITWTLDGFCGGIFNCRAGDEVIYYNIKAEDPYVMNARKRFDFTHTTKSQPKIPKRRSEEEQSLYGEYNNLLLDINLDPLSEAYLVRITDETGKVVYEKAINAGSIVALNIDISAYAAGRYTVTVENSQETFTGEFDTQTTGIRDALRLNNNEEIKNKIYNLQGQRLSTLQRGLNIVNGKKVYVK